MEKPPPDFSDQGNAAGYPDSPSDRVSSFDREFDPTIQRMSGNGIPTQGAVTCLIPHSYTGGVDVLPKDAEVRSHAAHDPDDSPGRSAVVRSDCVAVVRRDDGFIDDIFLLGTFQRSDR